MATERRKQYALRFKPSIHEKAKALAFAENRPFSNYVENLIIEDLKRKSDKSGSPDVGLSTPGEGDGKQTSRKGRG